MGAQWGSSSCNQVDNRPINGSLFWCLYYHKNGWSLQVNLTKKYDIFRGKPKKHRYKVWNTPMLVSINISVRWKYERNAVSNIIRFSQKEIISDHGWKNINMRTAFDMRESKREWKRGGGGEGEREKERERETERERERERETLQWTCQQANVVA